MHSVDTRKPLLIYFIVLTLFWIAAAFLLIQKGYEGSFLYLNSFDTPFLDNLVPHLTQLGDSLILSSLFLLLGRVNASLSLTAVISIITSGLVLIALKQLVFHDWHRPLTVLKDVPGIHSIEGYIEYYTSFPSGHATSVASALPVLTLLIRRNPVLPGLIAVLTACLCFTRIYLASHFLGDVLAGSMLGSVFAILCIAYVYPRILQKLTSGVKSSTSVGNILFIIGLVGLLLGLALRYLIA